LRVKINEISDKVDKIDKLLAEVFINKELELTTSRENINTENNSKSKKKVKEEKTQKTEKIEEDLNEISGENENENEIEYEYEDKA
jgi:hypothetical protein